MMRWIAGPIVSRLDPFRPAKGAPPRRLVPFVRWATAGAWPIVGLTLLISFVTGMSELFAAWFTGWAIDQALAAGPGAFWTTLGPVLIAGAVFFILIRPIIMGADASTSAIFVGPYLLPLILTRVIRYTLGHSMRYFDNDFAGRISQKAMQTARALTDVFIDVIDIVFYGLSMFLGALILIGGLDWRLLLGFTVWLVLYLSALRYFIPPLRARAEERAQSRTLVTGQIVDTLSNIATVKLFAQDLGEERAAVRALDDFRKVSLEFGYVSATYRWVLMTLGGLLPFLGIGGSLYLWSIGQGTAGDVAFTSMVATRLSQVSNRMGFVSMGIFSNIGEVIDGIGTLAVPHEIRDAVPTTKAKGTAIGFEGVRFAYGGEIPALTDLSLSIAPGEKVALVGRSGAGKSTIVSLLLRLYDVEGGRITLGGTDIRQMSQAELRGKMAMVRQETAMFNRSAMDNIRYGRPDAADHEVISAAEAAAAHEFIGQLEDHNGRRGYAARLGERGVKLSGGQRQRIAIARALLKDAPILILDEATSALDSEVEAVIQSTLYDAMQGKTVIAIAHRLSTIAQMDRIVVLDQGRIAEEGRHDALLARGGIYAGLWQRQSGGFLAED